MDVSENGGTPKSAIFYRVFHYKPSILGYPYFWKHPNVLQVYSDGLKDPMIGQWVHPDLRASETRRKMETNSYKVGAIYKWSYGAPTNSNGWK